MVDEYGFGDFDERTGTELYSIVPDNSRVCWRTWNQKDFLREAEFVDQNRKEIVFSGWLPVVKRVNQLVIVELITQIKRY